MGPLDAVTRRVLGAHVLASLALSVPWPLLLVLVDERSDDPLLLGLAGAARMLPFVVCSWAAGRLADVVRRDRLVRLTFAVRVVLMLVAAAAVVSGHVWTAVLASTLAVAVATPAYPALVAAMPGLAGYQHRRATELLVTVEVGAFVVGAALGGLLLHPALRGALPWVPVVLTLAAWPLLRGAAMPAPLRPAAHERGPSALAALLAAPAAVRAVAVMACVNLVAATLVLALLPLALDTWGTDAAGYGLATGVFGFAALAAPLLSRLGRTPERAAAHGLGMLAVALLLLAPTPTLAWAVLPLALAGSVSVAVEAAATGVLQEAVPDAVRGTVLGLNDTVIVTAALVGSLLAPLALHLLGAEVLLGGTALLVLLAAVRTRVAARFEEPAAPSFPLRPDVALHPHPLPAPGRHRAARAGDVGLLRVPRQRRGGHGATLGHHGSERGGTPQRRAADRRAALRGAG